MPKLLPDPIIAERAGDDDLRYRLVGTGIVQAHGLDYTGWFLSDLATRRDAHALGHQLYGPALQQGLPVYSEGPFRWPGGEFRRTLPSGPDRESRGDHGGRGRDESYLRCG